MKLPFDLYNRPIFTIDLFHLENFMILYFKYKKRSGDKERSFFPLISSRTNSKEWWVDFRVGEKAVRLCSVSRVPWKRNILVERNGGSCREANKLPVAGPAEGGWRQGSPGSHLGMKRVPELLHSQAAVCHRFWSCPCRAPGTALFPALEPVGPRVWEECSPFPDV